MTDSRWRERARQVIDDAVTTWLQERGLDATRKARVLVLRGLEPEDQKALLTVVSAAYPYGERSAHPYKMWLKEVEMLRRLMGVFGPARQPAGVETAG